MNTSPTESAAIVTDAQITESDDWFSQLLEVVSEYRQGDPTAPVTVLVSSNEEVQLLRTTLARSAHNQLRIGITVAKIGQAAATDVPLADSWAVTQCVRDVQADGYFRKLADFAGVAETLGSAVLLWDQASPKTQNSLIESSRCQADMKRLQGISDLHTRVQQRLTAEHMCLPSAIAKANFGPAHPRLWVNAVLAAPSNPEAIWLQRLEETCNAVGAAARAAASALSSNDDGPTANAHRYCRLDPASTAPAPSSTEHAANRGSKSLHVHSAVDPFDEAGIAARLMTQAMEQGTPVRDALIATPDSGLGRYRNLVGSNLSAAGVPNDAETVVNFAGTTSGRAVMELLSALREIDEPRALRFDHVVAIIRAGKIVDSQGETVTAGRLREVWRALRGTDPASWSSQVAPCPDDAEAASVVQQVAAILATMVAAKTTPDKPKGGISSSHATDALADLLGMIPVRSVADAGAATAFRNVLARWRDASEKITAVIMQEDLSQTAAMHLAPASGGVRIVPLQAAWCSGARVLVAVGMADDLIPGVTGNVGPLMPDEITLLRDPGVQPWRIAEDHQRALAAARVNCGEVIATFPRSDQLRTVVREQSRILDEIATFVTELGSITSHIDRLEKGEFGLLGKADAAAAVLRQGSSLTAVAQTLGVDVEPAVACMDARLHPPVAGQVDAFNGDVQELARDTLTALLSPTVDVSGAAATGPRGQSSTRIVPDPGGDEHKPTSPSKLESLMGCPIGWWAKEVVGISELEPWDPRDFDPRLYGTWVHQALSLLSTSDQLLSRELTDELIQRALFDAVGGASSTAAPNTETADRELLGLRFRVDFAQILRATADIHTIANQLRTFLEPRLPVLAHHEEMRLDPQRVELPFGSVVIGGRVDRIDRFKGNQILVTDYKTGRSGDGFQLAVYAWLWALQGQLTQPESAPEAGSAEPGTYLDTSTPFSAELLYATTSTRGAYQQTQLAFPSTAGEPPPETNSSTDTAAGRPTAATTYSETQLRDFLIESLGDIVSSARAGRFPSQATQKEHNRYCPVCTGLVASAGWKAAGNTSDRVAALAQAQPSEPATINADAGEESR